MSGYNSMELHKSKGKIQDCVAFQSVHTVIELSNKLKSQMIWMIFKFGYIIFTKFCNLFYLNSHKNHKENYFSMTLQLLLMLTDTTRKSDVSVLNGFNDTR
jgi:hypothetical protein